MAAGALARSRGVAGVRTTKGLYFIFTLLCLVCLSSSLINKENLERAKKLLKSAQQKAAKIKAAYESDHDFASELMEEYIRFMDPMIEIFKKRSHDFPPLLELMDNLRTFLKKSKSYVDKGDEETVARIKKNEKQMREMEKLIKYLEENQYEL